MAGQAICRDDKCEEQLNTIENVKFENNKLSFYGSNCVRVNENEEFGRTDTIRKFDLSIKNDKINLEVTETFTGFGAGAIC